MTLTYLLQHLTLIFLMPALLSCTFNLVQAQDTSTKNNGLNFTLPGARPEVEAKFKELMPDILLNEMKLIKISSAQMGRTPFRLTVKYRNEGSVIEMLFSSTTPDRNKFFISGHKAMRKVTGSYVIGHEQFPEYDYYMLFASGRPISGGNYDKRTLYMPTVILNVKGELTVKQFEKILKSLPLKAIDEAMPPIE